MAIGEVLGRIRRSSSSGGGSKVKANRLVVGLGNPGPQYQGTRHNAGFMVIEALARRWRLRFGVPRDRSRFAVGEIKSESVALLEPLTYMNLSGRSVAWGLRTWGLPLEALLVIHDDVDLPFGRLRLRPSGSSAGHRGVQSIIESLGSDCFPRLRIGVGRPDGGEVADFVLAPFSAAEEREFDAVLESAATAVEAFVADGIQAAMNQFNQKS